jgi:hypothetical protein
MNLFQDRPETEWDFSLDFLLNRLHQKNWLEVLMQVHDSLAGQFPTSQSHIILPRIKELSKIVVPYDDPLIIPTSIKTSTVSWGAC